MNGIRLVLDRGAVLRLAVGSVIAAQLIFIAGAVVGFALHGDGVPQLLPATIEAPEVAQATETPRRPTAVVGQDAAAGGGASAVVAEPADAVGAAAADSETRASTPPTPAAPPEGAPSSRFAVQLGAFRSDANARQLQADLGRRGYEVVIVRRQNAAGTWLHHVQLVDEVLTREEATVVAGGIQDRERIPAAAVRIGDPVGS